MPCVLSGKAQLKLALRHIEEARCCKWQIGLEPDSILTGLIGQCSHPARGQAPRGQWVSMSTEQPCMAQVPRSDPNKAAFPSDSLLRVMF